MTGFRLERGGAIDRTQPRQFRFGGRQLSGFEGDTLASALLGAGVSVVGRSMKFHRPRGILTAGVEEPNALVTLGVGSAREPSVRATVQPLFEGLHAESQNCWPALGFDLGRVNDILHRLFPAGFYNKTFIWPNWHAFEPMIRRMAGIGVAPEGADPDRYQWRNAHCDVLVVGGGLAGMFAASAAAGSGARVILIESDARLGGGLNWERESASGSSSVGSGPSDVASAARQLAKLPNLRVIVQTTAVASYDHGLVTAIERCHQTGEAAPCHQRWWRIRTKRIVLATGAFEQPLAFPFNDRPGVMLADAVRHYVNRYAVSPGRQIAIATNNDSAYQVVTDLRAAGIAVPCVLDTRDHVDSALVASAASAGVPVYKGARILRANGSSHLRSLDFVAQGHATARVACDALGMSGGWNPVANLYCQAGGRLRFDKHHACLVPDGKLETIQVMGGAAALFDRASTLAHARTCVQRILESLGFRDSPRSSLWHDTEPARARAATGELGDAGPTLRDRTWLDFQHDVTVADIDLAVRENLTSVEHVKRYTTVGMSVDQGKTSNLNALSVLAKATRRDIATVGTTTFRPMFVPVTLGAIAGGRNGRFYRPRRLLPAHEQHVSRGAHFEDYGGWQRPRCYPLANEPDAVAIQREVRAVRTGVGIFDGSPLGKILVRGPDAARFLERMYANGIETLQPGKVRYGLMLNERGIVIDDGVCARLSAEELWVHTTSSGAARISSSFEEWLQGEWPDLQVAVSDLTSQWATLNLAGPKARTVLASLPCDIDLSPGAFPHMHARTGLICGTPCRILRVSYTGELSYEISVPAGFGASLWERLCAAGSPFGITAFGVEAVLVMRTEKGYLHVGSDTDGTTVPADIGFGDALARKRGDFVGRRSLSVPEAMRPDRLQLVGLVCKDGADAFLAGAHILDAATKDRTDASSGYLTSAVFSPTLGAHVGLGLLRNGRQRQGEIVDIVDGNRRTRAQVVNPSHYDAAGTRLHG